MVITRQCWLFVLIIILILGVMPAVCADPTPIPTNTQLMAHFDEVVNSTGNISVIGPLLFKPYEDFLGTQVFWGILWAIIFVGMFLTQEETSVILILVFLVGGIILSYSVIPPEYVMVAHGLMVVALMGVGYLLIMKKVR